MGICKKIERKDLKWYQKLWNILIGHSERNYYYVESIEDERRCK